MGEIEHWISFVFITENFAGFQGCPSLFWMVASLIVGMQAFHGSLRQVRKNDPILVIEEVNLYIGCSVYRVNHEL